MSDFTDYLEAEIIEWSFDGTSFAAAPDPVYVGLHTSDPGDSPDGSTEVGTGSYSRVSVSASDWTTTTSTADNDKDVTFPEATANWGTVTHFTIWDGSSSSDNALYVSALDNSRDIQAGDVARFQAGELNFEVK